MLVQIMVDTVLKKMLIERDVENAKAYTRTKISELLQVGLNHPWHQALQSRVLTPLPMYKLI